MASELEQERVKQAITSFCMSRAILEDYARTIARIEGRNEEEVLQRVRVRTRELMREVQGSLMNSKVAEQPIASVNITKQPAKTEVLSGNVKQPELFVESRSHPN